MAATSSTTATAVTATRRAPAARLGRLVDRWLLPIYVVGVTAYLILPVAVMILFSFNDPDRPLEPELARVLARRVAQSARPPRSGGGRAEQPRHRVRVDPRRDDAGHDDRPGAVALLVPRPVGDEHPHLPADVDARDRPRRLAADDVRRVRPAADPGGARVPAQHPDHPDRAHHVQHQLRRRDREGATGELPASPRGGCDGPRARTSGRRSGRSPSR